MRRFYEERHMGIGACTQYSAMTVDVKIFDRILKVVVCFIQAVVMFYFERCYDASDGRKLLRQNVSI